MLFLKSLIIRSNSVKKAKKGEAGEAETVEESNIGIKNFQNINNIRGSNNKIQTVKVNAADKMFFNLLLKDRKYKFNDESNIVMGLKSNLHERKRTFQKISTLAINHSNSPVKFTEKKNSDNAFDKKHEGFNLITNLHEITGRSLTNSNNSFNNLQTTNANNFSVSTDDYSDFNYYSKSNSRYNDDIAPIKSIFKSKSIPFFKDHKDHKNEKDHKGDNRD